MKRVLVSYFLTLNFIWKNIKYLKRIVACGLSLFSFFTTFTENDRFKTKSRTLRMMTESLGDLQLILSKRTYFGGRLMVLNVQITMTNDKRWPCLIYDFYFCSIHSKKEACIQAKGNSILWLTVEILTSCDWGLGLWTIVLLLVTIKYWWDCRGFGCCQAHQGVYLLDFFFSDIQLYLLLSLYLRFISFYVLIYMF